MPETILYSQIPTVQGLFNPSDIKNGLFVYLESSNSCQVIDMRRIVQFIDTDIIILKNKNSSNTQIFQN